MIKSQSSFSSTLSNVSQPTASEVEFRDDQGEKEGSFSNSDNDELFPEGEADAEPEENMVSANHAEEDPDSNSASIFHVNRSCNSLGRTMTLTTYGRSTLWAAGFLHGHPAFANRKL